MESRDLSPVIQEIGTSRNAFESLKENADLGEVESKSIYDTTEAGDSELGAEDLDKGEVPGKGLPISLSPILEVISPIVEISSPNCEDPPEFEPLKLDLVRRRSVNDLEHLSKDTTKSGKW